MEEAIQVIVGGEPTIFASKADAAKHFGVSSKMFCQRLRRKWTPEQAAELDPPPKRRHYKETSLVVKTAEGIREFRSYTEAAIAYGLKPLTLCYRLRAGWSPEQAVGLAKPPRKKKTNTKRISFSSGGVDYVYESIAEAARTHGFENEFLVYGRVNSGGWTYAQALEIEPPPPHSKSCYGYIYVITHIESGRKYVGQTMLSVHDRFEEHVWSAEAGSDRPLPAAIREYGEDAFAIEEVEKTSSLDDANRKERRLIRSLGTLFPNGFNLTRGGGGTNRPGKTVKIDGKVFQSQADAERYFGMRLGLLGERLLRGWTLRQAVGLDEEPPTAAKRGVPVAVDINGKPKTFKSLQAAARHFGLNPMTVNQRVAVCGWTHEEALEIVPPTSKWANTAVHLEVKGVSLAFPTVAEACRHFNVRPTLIYDRLSKGWSQPEAFGLVSRKKPKPQVTKAVAVKVNGHKQFYSSLTEAAETYGLSMKLVSNRINRLGWSVEEALGLVKRKRQK